MSRLVNGSGAKKDRGRDLAGLVRAPNRLTGFVSPQDSDWQRARKAAENIADLRDGVVVQLCKNTDDQIGIVDCFRSRRILLGNGSSLQRSTLPLFNRNPFVISSERDRSCVYNCNDRTPRSGIRTQAGRAFSS